MALDAGSTPCSHREVAGAEGGAEPLRAQSAGDVSVLAGGTSMDMESPWK